MYIWMKAINVAVPLVQNVYRLSMLNVWDTEINVIEGSAFKD